MTEIVTPFAQFFDTNGAPLNNGAIFIGTAYLDAQSNQIPVYWDNALTIPAAQPIRTLNGYAVRNGAPARIFCNADNFSMTVQTSTGRTVWAVQDAASEIEQNTSNQILDTLAASNGSSLVGFISAGTGAEARTAQDKMRDVVNVKDYGAIGDGAADDTAAFAAAAAFSKFVTVPKGTYKLASDVTASDVVFELQDATLSGDGKLKANSIISKDESGIYTSLQNGFFRFDNQTKSFSDLAAINPGDYPRKYYPAATWVELLRLSPAITQFENQSGDQTNAMNETYFRGMIREISSVGIQSIILPYIEYQGFWFYKPGFAFPYDYDTSRLGQYWADWLTAYPNVTPFNPLAVMLDECAKLGMRVYVGLGRNGDTPILNDIYAVNILGTPDPMRFGLSLHTRLSNAVSRTQQVAADINAQYGHIPSLAGFYISHEPDHLASSNNYLAPVTTTGGANPSLRSYGKPIMVAPSSPLDLAATSSFANAMIASGCDIFLPQDSVGPGFDFNSNVYTYVPTVPIGQIAAHFSKWNAAATIANAKRTLSNRSIRLWTTTEIWQMGVVQSMALTLSATSGAGITATAASSAFVAGDVGKWISTADGGNAQITGYTSASVVTVSTAATGGRAFGGTSQLANNWSLNSQYANAYPGSFSRVQSQLLEEWPYIEAVSLYAWLGFADSGTLALRLSQTNSGFTDYRTRAGNLYQDYAAWQAGQVIKYANAPNVAVVQQQFFERAAEPAAVSLTSDFATFYPRSDGSRVTYFCVIRGLLANGISTLTMGLRVNGILVKSSQDAASSNLAGGTYTFMYSELPKGANRSVGISFSSTGANFTLFGAEVYVIETA